MNFTSNVPAWYRYDHHTPVDVIEAAAAVPLQDKAAGESSLELQI